jgi:hypothetical protein
MVNKPHKAYMTRSLTPFSTQKESSVGILIYQNIMYHMLLRNSQEQTGILMHVSEGFRSIENKIFPTKTNKREPRSDLRDAKQQAGNQIYIPL